MGELLLVSTIASGVALAYLTSKVGMRWVVDMIPVKRSAD